MDRLDAMTVFVRTVDSGSLSAAARKLGMPLTTVSRKLSELETHLGVQLLARSTRKLALTDAGAAYLLACREVLERVSEAERAITHAHQAPQGQLTLTAPLVFGRIVLLPILLDFLTAYPEVDLRLQLGDRNLDLMEDQIDLALRIGTLPDTALRAIQVGDVREVICGSPEHLRRHGQPKTLDQLATHPCITFSTLDHPRQWNFGSGRQRQVVAVKSRLEVNTAEAAIDAAIAGAGLTRVLSYQVQEAVAQGALNIVLASQEPPPRPVSLLFRAAHPLPLKLRTLIDFAVPRLREQLGS